MCGRSLHNSSMSLSSLGQQPQDKKAKQLFKNTTVNSLCITNERYTTWRGRSINLHPYRLLSLHIFIKKKKKKKNENAEARQAKLPPLAPLSTSEPRRKPGRVHYSTKMLVLGRP